MPKKRNRYSSNLPTDWVVTTLSAGEATEEVQEDQSQTYRVEKSSRYKKVLPANWIESNSDPDTVSGNAPMQSTHSHSQPQSTTQRALGVDTSNPRKVNSGYSPPPAPTTDKKLSFPPNKPEREDSTLLPPPPHRHMKVESHQRRSDEGSRITPGAGEGSSTSQYHRAASFHPYYSSSAISPPVSVGQQSSEATTSPFHGRDLPAKRPAVSPTYSVF